MRARALTDRMSTAVFVFALCVKLGALALLGPVWTPDSRVYIALAREFAGQVPLRSTLPEVNYWFLYSGYPLMLAPMARLLPEDLALGTAGVLCQATLAAASAGVLYGMLLGLTGGRPRWALTLTAAYVLNPDLLIWDRAVLSDSLNLSALILALRLLLTPLSQEPATTVPPMPRLLPAILAYLVLLRPTNLVFVGLSAAFLLASRGASAWAQRVVLAIGLGALLLAGALALQGTKVGALRGVDISIGWLTGGVVIDGRPEYDVPIRTGPDALEPSPVAVAFRTAARRAAFFWSLWLGGYSVAHKAVAGLYYLPLWLGAVAGANAAIRRRHGLAGRFLVLLPVAYTLFHSVTLLDFDLRYRVVVLPALFCLSALGGEVFRRTSST